MQQEGSRAPERETHPNEESVPVVRGYENYKASGGILSQAEYQSVLERAADSKNVPSVSTEAQATHMAQASEIVLSPETVTIYGILRHDEKPSPDTKGHYSALSDQKLLAEALRLVGDERPLTTFIEKYPHISN